MRAYRCGDRGAAARLTAVRLSPAVGAISEAWDVSEVEAEGL
jgi:hypothetical protein